MCVHDHHQSSVLGPHTHPFLFILTLERLDAVPVHVGEWLSTTAPGEFTRPTLW